MFDKSSMQVKLPDGLLPKIGTIRGVRQGCSLSPTLFNLFLSDQPNFLLSNTDEHVELNFHKLCCLLYADDLVLVSS
jgi:hypothetical protein